MSRAYPLRFASPDQIVTVRRNLKGVTEKIVKAAVGEGQDVITRDLTPADFQGVPGGYLLGQFLNQVVGVAAPGAYVQALITNPQIPNNRAIAIYGIADLAAVPTLMQAQFLLGTSATMEQVQLDTIWASGVSVALLDPAIIYKPLDIFNPRFLFNAATAAFGEAIEFWGVVSEPAGVTVALLPDHSVDF